MLQCTYASKEAVLSTRRTLMKYPTGFALVSKVPPTINSARSVQELLLQDLLAADSPHPEEQANPRAHHMVRDQLDRMRAQPERYSGYMSNGRLVALLIHGNWLIEDELPFAVGVRAINLRTRQILRRDPHTGQWGISSLIASIALNDAVRQAMLTNLLTYGMHDKEGRPRTTNIVLHSSSPLQKIIPGYGFRLTGKPGEVAGVPGVQHRLYRRLVLT